MRTLKAVQKSLRHVPCLLGCACMQDGATPLHAAARNGHVEVMKLLLAAKAKVSAQKVDGASPLFLSAQNGHVGTVELLLAK